MIQSAPLLNSSSTILWLKVLLTALSLGMLFRRYKNRNAAGLSAKPYSPLTKAILLLAVLFSFGVFHSLGKPRSGTFVHYGEMFHYYLGAKYFKELGYYDLYQAVIIADAEQDNALASLPFYTDLTNYQNAPRKTALEKSEVVKSHFSSERWTAFKADVAFFKEATATPGAAPGVMFFLMDHGYNASPVTTFVLGIITNIVPVTQLRLLALLDVLLMATMIAFVFRTFGFEMGALFSIYFFVNILNDNAYISGGLLRYDWLFCIVVAVCLMEKRHYASSAALLTASAMIRIFPIVLFYGIGVSIVRKIKTARTVGKESKRFVLAAAVAALGLFLLPTLYLGSALQPWQAFFAKSGLHNDGVYVNHLGLRGIVLFEPSHLSLDRFVVTYRNGSNGDVVRHWQDVKEEEFRHKKPLILFCSLLVLACITAIIWRGKKSVVESVLWPLPLIYMASYPSHYYYAFLCLFVLLFFTRADPLSAVVPLALLLLFNIIALITDSFGPSPIVFYTSVNIWLFMCLTAILGFELYVSVLRRSPTPAVAIVERPARRNTSAKRKRGKRT